MAKKKPSENSADKTEQGRRNQNLGDVAADHVKLWASQLRFLVNESQRDRTGWDQYFEFSSDSADETNFPPGMPTRALSCKVQVKGIKRSRRTISLKLSTLFNFVEEPIPYFIVVLVFGSNTTEPENVYLIHIWEEIIANALERICKLSDRERKKLHKKSLSLHLNPQDQLPRPWAASLGERIARCTGSNLFEYAQKKKQHYETVGFQDNYRNFRVTFQAPSVEELYERFSRLAVGLEAVEFIKFEESRKRFDVSYPVRNLPSDPGLLRMPATNQNRSWRVEVAEADLSDPIDLSCAVRSSVGVFPFLPESYWLVRIETRFLDILIRYARNQLTFSFQGPEADQRIEFSELYWTCRLLERLSSTTNQQLIFRIYGEGMNKEKLGFRIFTPAVTLPDETRDLIKKIKATWLVFRNLDFDPHVLLSLRELASMQPGVSILETTFSRIKVRAEAVVPQRTHLNRCSIVTFPTIKMGETVHVFSVAISGIPKLESVMRNDMRVIVESDQPNLLQRRTVSATEWNKFDYDVVVESAKNLLKQQGIEDTVFIRAPIRGAAELRRAAKQGEG